MTGKLSVFTEKYNGGKDAARVLLEKAGLAGLLRDALRRDNIKNVLIKPNLVNSTPPPVTTPAWIVREIVSFVRNILPECAVIIAEGAGDINMETDELFTLHGYRRAMSDVIFMDLNHEPCRRIKLARGLRWKELFLPEILFESFVISAPVLKAHTLAGVTLSMKNMIGVSPPEHYQEGGAWKKSAFHLRIHESIFDLNCARAPDFTLLDATVGMATSHLGGPECVPPVNTLVAGADPVAVDAFGAGLLGNDWRHIGHIRMADGVLGHADRA